MKKDLHLCKWLRQITYNLLSIVLLTALTAGLTGSNGAHAAGKANTPNKLTATAAKKPATVSILYIKRFDNETNPSNLSLIKFSVALSASVTGVTKNNFELVTVGVTGASIKSVITIGAGSFTINVNTGTGDGKIGVRMINDAGMSATVSTPLPYDSDEVFTMDKTAPAFSISTPSPAITKSGPVSFTVTYSDANLDVSSMTLANKVIVNKTGTVSYNGVSTSHSGNIETVQVLNLSGDGTFSISIADGTVSDLAGNMAAASGPSASVIVDNTPPTVTISAPSTTLERNGTITYTITYSDINLDTGSITLTPDDIIVNKTSTANAGAVSVTGSGNTRTVQLKNISGHGDLSISIPANLASDLAGNSAAAAGPSATTAIDNVLPNVKIGSPSTMLTKSGPISYNVTYSDLHLDPGSITLSANDIIINKTGNVAVDSITVSGTGSIRTVVLDHISGDGTVGISIPTKTASDLVGNMAVAAGPSTTATIDNTPPAITISGPSVSNITAGSGSVSYTVTYDDTNFNSGTLSPNDVTLNTTGTASGTVTTSVAGNIGTVTISNITGAGSLGISIGAGTATDLAGNPAPAAGPSATFDVKLIQQHLNVWIVSTKNYGDADFAVDATTDSYDIPIIVTSNNPAVATIVNGNIHIVGTGTTFIFVSQAGDATHTAAAVGWSLTVNPAPLTITAENKTINYGAALPAFTATYSGFVNGDGQAAVTTLPSLSSTGTPTSAPGNYPILISGAVAANYTITYVPGTLTVVGSSDAAFAGLTLSSGTLSPAFSPAIGTYSATVPFSVSSITCTPVAHDSNATTKVNFHSSSSPVTLNVGANTIYIEVIAQNGNTVKLDTLTVTRIAGSSDATLAGLTLSNGTLSPAFSPEISSYASTVPYSAASITVTPTTNNPNATVTVNGNSASTPVALKAGSNFILVTVTAENGTTSKRDTLTVTRTAPSADAALAGLTLSSGTLSPQFSPEITSYTSTVPYSTAGITVTPTTNNPNATATVNGHSPATPVALNVGLNFMLVAVTAENGATSKFDTLRVTRSAPSADAALGGLSISSGTLSPAFSPAISNYSNTVTFSNATITVTPTPNYPGATVKVNDHSPSTPVALNIGPNFIWITVTAQNGYTAIDTLTVTRLEPSNDATLANLTISSGTLQPEFAAAALNYTASVANGVASITITPTANAEGATIKVNGTATASGTASVALPLAFGPNTITTVVTAPDGTTTKTYTLTVNRTGSNNALLNAIKISPATTLTPVSGPDYKDYTTIVPVSETSVRITPTAQDATATIRVNGVTVASGKASAAIALNVGENVINTVVTAQDGVTKNTYSIKFIRLANADLANLTLSSGVLSPAFAAATTGYTAAVSNATESVTVTPATSDAAATVKVNGVTVASGLTSAAIPLNIGLNIITTVVTAADGTTTKTYTLTVTRISNNALLNAIKITPATGLTLVTGADYKDYITTVPNSQTSVKITPVAQDAAANIQVNGLTVASGAASAAIPLNVGINVINTVVTASDGVTKNTYSIQFTRLAKAELASLTLSSGVISPVFATGTTSYSATVSDAAISVTPTTFVAGATVKVNGVDVPSGTASPSTALTFGPNVIITVVTATDGTTTKTYTLTVTRVSNNALLNVIKATPATTLTLVSGADYRDYTTTVPNSQTSVKITATAQDATATIKVNGVAVASGTASAAIALNVGDNVINTVVTAQDGVTKNTYSIKFTRQAPAGAVLLYTEKADPVLDNTLLVRQNVSPNGDGNGDVLIIEGIRAYPDNTLQIMNRTGALVYEAKGYDNTTKVFDGHSSTNGKLQQAGTYFYSLDYKDGGETKRKTGFIVLKY